MNLDKLFLVAINDFIKKTGNKAVQWEDVVKSCFEMFSEEFSFEKYKQWPDTWKIHNCMWRCRNQRNWIAGNAKKGFSITKLGEDIINKESKKGKMDTSDVKKRKNKPGASGKMLKNIQNNSFYRKFILDESIENMQEKDFYIMLQCSLEAQKSVIRRNFDYFLGIAKEYDEKKVVSFLNKCGELFKLLLEK